MIKLILKRFVVSFSTIFTNTSTACPTTISCLIDTSIINFVKSDFEEKLLNCHTFSPLSLCLYEILKHCDIVKVGAMFDIKINNIESFTLKKLYSNNWLQESYFIIGSIGRVCMLLFIKCFC